MPMPTREYWAQRFEQLEASQNKDSVVYFNSVAKEMEKAQARITKELNAWYARFASENGITLADARKLLNSKELDEFKWTVEEYIKIAESNKLDPKWMKQLENASARFHISRLEALQINIQQKAEELFGNYSDSIDDYMAGVYTNGFFRTAYEVQKGLGIGSKIIGIDDKRIEKVITTPWTADGINFSERVWKSKAQLIESLKTELVQACVLGQSTKKSADQLASLTSAYDKDIKRARSQAARLIQTESAYFGSLSRKDCFSDLDVEEYEIVATLDSKTSEICQDLDGEHFPMSQYEIGVTAPPFHVNCRTTTCPYFNDEFTEGDMRAARGTDGKTYYIPANISYKEWFKKYAE